MKKFFTLIAAVAMAASVNAQTAKTFTKDTYLGTIPQNVLSWVSEGWVDKYGEDGPTLANKKGNINPETGEVKDKNGYNGSCIMLKSWKCRKIF